MNIDVQIDATQLEELTRRLGSIEAALQAVIPLLAERTYLRIRELAESELHTTLPIYLGALQIDTEAHEVVLDANAPGAKLAWQVEHGTAGGDMKDRLGGAESMVIPFRHAAPGSASRTGQPMGSPYAKFGWWKKYANKLGRETYAEAKKLGPGQRFLAIGQPTARVHHQYPIYEGLRRRVIGNDANPLLRGRASYETFRTMHEDSPGWQYPAIEGHHFFQRVADHEIQKFVAQAIEDLLGD